jgi:hypothetical protein
VPGTLFHFSEDPTIQRFEPHVPPTNPTLAAAVWAIDAAHAPLYWFPRDCPRVTVWPRDAREEVEFRATFGTSAARVHATESSWLATIRAARVFRYDFDAEPFRPWSEANGQWIATCPVEPVEVTPIGDLLALHADAGIELRLVPDLWPLHDLAVSDRWDFSIVRMHNARRRR